MFFFGPGSALTIDVLMLSLFARLLHQQRAVDAVAKEGRWRAEDSEWAMTTRKMQQRMTTTRSLGQRSRAPTAAYRRWRSAPANQWRLLLQHLSSS